MGNKMSNQPILESIRAFQKGSRDAFEVLVKHYQNLVTSVAFARVGDVQRSEDIAQQTFLVAWQKQDELTDPSRFGAWIRGIANNLARNERRLKENVRQSEALEYDEQDGSVVAADSSDPQEASSNREQSELLWATLDRIPIEYREPLVLFYREEKSVAEVAEQMELSTDAVKQRLKRARAMVKDEIQTMVEEFLTESGPSPRFSAAVMAMIPAAGAKLSATAVKTGAAMSGKTIGSKIATAFGASSLSAAGLAAVVGGIWAFLVGAGIAWIQTKKVADRATSDIEKAIHWDDYWKVLFGLAALFLALGLTSMLGLGRAAAYAWWLPVPVLFQWSMIHSLKKQLKLRRIRRVHGRPENEKGMVEPLLSYTPPSSSGATWGIIWGLIGAWGWLIVMLAVGAWFKLVFLFVLLIGTGIFAWLLAVGSKVLNDDMNYAQRQRVSGEFLWKACLVQASFCAAILLLFLDPSVGQYLIKTFQVQVSEKGMTTDLNTPATSMLLLWCVCPFIVTLAGVLRWSSVSRADLADEEHELGWDDGNGKVLYNHPASLGSK